MMTFVSPIHLRVIGHAARRPDRIAVRHDGSGYSYGALALRSRRAATVLADCGVRPGDRVAAPARGDARFLEVLMGCGILGAIVVPLNERWDGATCRAVLADSGAALVIDPDPATRDGAAEMLTADDFDRGIVGADPAPVPGVLPAGRPAMLCYTSGTTRTPTGAILTHGNLVANAQQVCAATGLSERDVTLPAASLARIGALGMVVLPALYAGARLVLPTCTAPAEVTALAAREGVTVMFAGPESYALLGEHPAFDAASLPALRVALTGSHAPADRSTTCSSAAPRPE